MQYKARCEDIASGSRIYKYAQPLKSHVYTLPHYYPPDVMSKGAMEI